MASILDSVTRKLARQERLTRDDALALYQADDIIRLGRLADGIKQARWGKQAHFVINRQINPSNICVLSETNDD